MPPLVRFMITHAAVGFSLSFLFVGTILALDISALRTLMAASDKGWLALSLLTFFCGLTFASVQMGLAVMMLSDDAPRPPQSGTWLGRLTDALATLLAPPRQHVYVPISTKPHDKRR